MDLLLLMAAVTLIIMLASFFALTREEREINREYAGPPDARTPVAGD